MLHVEFMTLQQHRGVFQVLRCPDLERCRGFLRIALVIAERVVATVRSEVHRAVGFSGDLQSENLSGVATCFVQIRGTQPYVSNVMQVDHEGCPLIYCCLGFIFPLLNK
ncbi:hypothetical protein D3C85_1300260 [compost metagenome]